MAKNEQKQVKKAMVESHKRPDGSKEYMLTKSPTKTLTGKIIMLVLVGGMIILPLIALIISIFQAL